MQIEAKKQKVTVCVYNTISRKYNKKKKKKSNLFFIIF